MVRQLCDYSNLLEKRALYNVQFFKIDNCILFNLKLFEGYNQNRWILGGFVDLTASFHG